MRLPYLPIGGRLKPALDLVLIHGSNRLTTRAMVDSGADFCVFDQQIASQLDLPLDQSAAIAVTGVGGRIIAYPGQLDAEIGRDLLHLRAYFAFDVPLNLLGRDDFFHHYVVEFDELNHTVDLKNRGISAPSPAV